MISKDEFTYILSCSAHNQNDTNTKIIRYLAPIILNAFYCNRSANQRWHPILLQQILHQVASIFDLSGFRSVIIQSLRELGGACEEGIWALRTSYKAGVGARCL